MKQEKDSISKASEDIDGPTLLALSTLPRIVTTGTLIQNTQKPEKPALQEQQTIKTEYTPPEKY